VNFAANILLFKDSKLPYKMSLRKQNTIAYFLKGISVKWIPHMRYW